MAFLTVYFSGLNFICIEKEGLKKFLYNETLSNFLLLTFLTYEELF
jgi:hypothetical protein